MTFETAYDPHNVYMCAYKNVHVYICTCINTYRYIDVNVDVDTGLNQI